MADRFLICLPYTLVQEGRPGTKPGDWTDLDGGINVQCWSDPRNFSNDPGDPGGRTFCGIIQAEYNKYRHLEGQPFQDVKALSVAEGLSIYQENYWLPHCPTLPAGLDLSVFDENVNTGPTQATRVLQHALQVHVDGIWGPQTHAAVAAISSASSKDMLAAIQRFTDLREYTYREMSRFGLFGKDWIARSIEIGNDSKAMVKP